MIMIVLVIIMVVLVMIIVMISEMSYFLKKVAEFSQRNKRFFYPRNTVFGLFFNGMGPHQWATTRVHPFPNFDGDYNEKFLVSLVFFSWPCIYERKI